MTEQQTAACPSCHGLNTSCPDGCGRDPATGELNGSSLEQTAATDNALVEKMSIECTSTHCERRQECASPRDCTGTAKRTRTPCEHCGVSDEQAIRDELHGTVVICDGCKAFVGHFTFDDEGSRP